MAARATMEPIASTKAGRLRGLASDGIYSFKGVPYGASTAERRFLPPEPPAPWSGIRDALDFGNSAPQTSGGGKGLYESWQNPRPSSEDCLVLNVYTPGLRDGSNRPVMVWLHGGSYSSGSGSSYECDGTRLARRGDVVVVTVNHRLNAFGYLYLAHLDAGLPDSGNVGHLDIVDALKWVRDNASEFGGDAGNVTLFGHSGGGQKITALTAMPAAAGLFHRGIVQSGPGLTAVDRSEAEETTAKVLAALEISNNDIGRLRTMPMAAVTAGIARLPIRFGPVLDQRSMPRHPFEPNASPVSRSVPLMIGCAKDETTAIFGARSDAMFHLTWETLPQQLAPGLTLGERAEDVASLDINRIIAELRRIEPAATPSDIYFTATTGFRFRHMAVREAERKAAQGGAPAYMYQFDWETPVDGGKWKSTHGVELGFVFDNVAKSASMIGTGPNLQKLADTMSDVWIRFARTGKPGWAPYTSAKRTTMVFDTVSRIVDDPRSAERRLFAGEA